MLALLTLCLKLTHSLHLLHFTVFNVRTACFLIKCLIHYFFALKALLKKSHYEKQNLNRFSFLIYFIVSAIVEYDYEAKEPDELDLVKGALIHNIKQMPGGWWEGTLQSNGKIGMFPDNFVRIIDNSDENKVTMRFVFVFVEELHFGDKRLEKIQKFILLCLEYRISIFPKQ